MTYNCFELLKQSSMVESTIIISFSVVTLLIVYVH